MSRHNFIINGLIIGSLTWSSLKFIDYVLTTNSLFLFERNLAQLSVILILVELFISSLIGGILGFILYPLVIKSEKINFDQQSTLSKTSAAESEKITTDDSLLKESADNNQIDSTITPLTSEEAAVINQKTEIKEEFEQKISSGTYEDPNVVVEKPGQTLVENPATMFNKPPQEDIKKTDLDDECFSKRNYESGVPKPGPYAPPPPPPPELKKKGPALKP